MHCYRKGPRCVSSGSPEVTGWRASRMAPGSGRDTTAVSILDSSSSNDWTGLGRASTTVALSIRARLGSGLLIGLEVLVAADVIRTVAFEPTLQSVAILGLLVVIRTFLSWALVVEIEDRWPWQVRKLE